MQYGTTGATLGQYYGMIRTVQGNSGASGPERCNRGAILERYWGRIGYGVDTTRQNKNPTNSIWAKNAKMFYKYQSSSFLPPANTKQDTFSCPRWSKMRKVADLSWE